uniref:Hexosyltransferase n=1 Tax=Chenopodium quinoa TaxID=63459 RepID=A0A803L6Y7_CHEQI
MFLFLISNVICFGDVYDLPDICCTNMRMNYEDVSLGSWLIGLDVTHVDDKNLCCGTPPDCEWKAQAGNVCGASFDWICSGICRSDESIHEVHQRCGESEDELWKATF